jgi:hypothetical protein
MASPAPSNPRMLFSYVALFALWGLTQAVLVSLSSCNTGADSQLQRLASQQTYQLITYQRATCSKRPSQ